ncbi:methyltransferase domain-containing protein [Fulvivirga lutimaris]|uniref:methyltransferase domain-containing protein n=1 Tax=Fulvivirga lutimaris TaxID=1819566 RepID=UPI001629885D
MRNNFNFIAPVYDKLGRLIFGNNLIDSQKAMLKHLKEGNHILILGGGSGEILKELDKQKIHLTISFVELSPKMIRLAKARQPFKNIEVTFICQNALAINPPNADVVITNYFLDVFALANLTLIMKKIENSLSTSGIWLCTDFRKTNSIFKNGLIKLMYLFFKIFSQLEANVLQDFEVQFETLGYKKIDSKFYFGKMIESCTYQKPNLTK